MKRFHPQTPPELEDSWGQEPKINKFSYRH